MRKLFLAIVLLLSSRVVPGQQKLSVHWEELTGPDFIQAIPQSGGTCLLPFGILEKHRQWRPGDSRVRGISDELVG
jgi:creatinine amidohydrolase